MLLKFPQNMPWEREQKIENNNTGENEVLAQYRRRHVWDDVLLRGFWFLFCFFLLVVDSKSRAAGWSK